MRAQVLKDGQVIDLTATEYRLLAFLAVRPDVPVPATDILMHVWGAAYTEEIGYVKSYVRRAAPKDRGRPIVATLPDRTSRPEIHPRKLASTLNLIAQIVRL